MEFINPKLNAYAEEHSSTETALLNKIDRETNLEVLRPRMLSGHLQGRILAMISQMINPEYIIEIGTYTGYSALCLAEGLKENGKLITIEYNTELEDRILSYFSESKYGRQLDLRIGDAIEILPALENSIDLVFIDADKVNYLNYYNLVIDKLKSGGYVLADNVLWSGKVIDEVNQKDKDTFGLIKFNSFVQNDSRVENVLLPVRDGLMLIRKK
jgi:predicted O-methyltransferase YrrM